MVWPISYEGTNTGLSLPSTRVDAFNIDLANELSRNGRRSGLTFAPEGGSERIRKVINKMVTEEDLIRTVAAAYGAGWRQVKLYFMCGFPPRPTRTWCRSRPWPKKVIRTGREVSGAATSAARCPSGFRAQAAHPVPVGRPTRVGGHRRPAGTLRNEIRSDRDRARRSGSGITTVVRGSWRACSHAGTDGSARSSSRSGATAGRFDGWSEYFSFDRWMAAADTVGIDVDWYTTRERDLSEVLPWDHLDSGLDKEWLWEDWQDAQDEVEVEDCRWTPCFDCGVCDQMGTEIQVGPTDRPILPIVAVTS